MIERVESLRIIQTARLLLRPFELADAADVFAYASNPSVSQYTSWHTHRTVADAEGFVAMVLARGPEEHTWAIRLVDEPRVIGAIEFSRESDDEAEFHYVLAPEQWNRGLMTEAARAVIDWGRARYPALRRIATRAMTENVASQRVMEKCGLRFERLSAAHSAKHGCPIEHREYVLLVEPMT